MAFVFYVSGMCVAHLVKSLWLAGGANEFQPTTIEAEIEFVPFLYDLRHHRYRLCCDMPIPFSFFFLSFFKTCSTHQKKI